MTRVRRRLGNRVLVPFNFSGAGQLDDAEDFEVFLAVPEAITLIDEFGVWARFREFTATATAASSGGGSTSGSGGGQTSSSAGTPSGGGSTQTSVAEGEHRHLMFQKVAETSAFTVREFGASDSGGLGPQRVRFQADTTTPLYTRNSDGTHDHDVTLPAHTHPNHSHTVDDHSHSTPAHAHGLTYGMFKETLPGSFNVALTVHRRPLDLSDPWTQVAAVTMTEQEQSLDLAALMSDEQLGPGLFRLVFLSNGGQPNGGRLGIDVMGWAMGSIASV